MNIYSLTKYLPEDIVRHVLSFDDRIVLRKGDGNLIFINKINKELYKDSYSSLLKKPLVKEGRTTTYNNEKYTWCSVRLWNYKNQYLNPYISYSSKNNEYIFKFNVWAKGGLYRESSFIMP
jgi:hypothetical protein|uniref:Uncharacterized protein n=1 Tax=viral metagenome TaxID=1070528 RepID=A0A6C0DBA6_9ZZZZ